MQSHPIRSMISPRGGGVDVTRTKRPRSELQFAAMVEAAFSLARAAFAFNSTNVEGLGLYARA